MQRTRLLSAAGLMVAGLGLGLAAQQKPAVPGGANAAKPVVSVYKSPT